MLKEDGSHWGTRRLLWLGTSRATLVPSFPPLDPRWLCTPGPVGHSTKRFACMPPPPPGDFKNVPSLPLVSRSAETLIVAGCNGCNPSPLRRRADFISGSFYYPPCVIHLVEQVHFMIPSALCQGIRQLSFRVHPPQHQSCRHLGLLQAEQLDVRSLLLAFDH